MKRRIKMKLDDQDKIQNSQNVQKIKLKIIFCGLIDTEIGPNTVCFGL